MTWRDVQYGESFGWMIVLPYETGLYSGSRVYGSLEEAQAHLRRLSCRGRVCFLAKVVLVHSADGS